MRAFDTNRWAGLGGVTLFVVGLGAIANQPALVLVAVVGAGYVAYAQVGEAPDPSVSIERTVSDPTPEPGETIDVTVSIENTGDGWLYDLRLVDGVPPAIEAPDRPARIATALRPSESTSVTYSATVVRGEHTWEEVRVVTRNPSGSRERETNHEIETTVRCSPTLEAGADLPLRGLTTQYAGRVVTDVGGSGVEFHSTREYRTGDPLNRIDWNRRARTGELATLELREERAATVVLLVDSRSDAHVTADPLRPSAVERSVAAVGRVFSTLTNSGDRVGLAAMSPADCWLPPGSGADHEARARELLAAHEGFAPRPTDGNFYPSLWFRRLRRRLPSDAQVVFFSPLVDDYALTVARRLDAHGHLVTVVSPDATTGDTPGRTLAALHRSLRLYRLRRSGIRVVDWEDEPLASTLTAAKRRWSR